MSTNGSDLGTKNSFLVTREEFESGMEQQVENIVDVMKVVNKLRDALNVQADVLGCHRYILTKFVPLPLLEQAAKEYNEAREADIAKLRTEPDAQAN